jgi:DNA-binding CsgD family transcriptional regulator
MTDDTLQLKPITPKDFFNYWDSKSVNNIDVSNLPFTFFKPFIDTIPKLTLGEYYWQIFNNEYPSPKILMLGGAVNKLTPYESQDLIKFNTHDYFSFFYPDDLKHTMTFLSKAFEVLFSLNIEERKNYNITIYTRIKNGEGHYVWNSLQYPALYFDENGAMLYGLVLYTNIHHLMKPNAQPMLTILDSSNKSKQIFTCYSPDTQEVIEKNYPSLNHREREIIALLSQGKVSKEISDILGISKSTVDNYRQGLLKKFDVKSSAELVIKALIL